MRKYVALLRGVNVGGRTIKMAELQGILVAAGFKNVQTVLQTGNVIAESEQASGQEVRDKLERLLSQQYGYAAQVLVYSPAELGHVVQAYPFAENDVSKHDYIIFVDGAAAELLAQCPPLDPAEERVSAGQGVIYWQVTKGKTLDSTFAKWFAKATRGSVTTARNRNTLLKIAAKAGE